MGMGPGQICFQLPPPYGYYCVQIPGGTPSGSFQPQSTVLPSSFGGLFSPAGVVALYPCLDLAGNGSEYRIFDVSQPPNDTINGSSYSWRVEQVESYRNPTIRKLFWTFTDLGQVTVTWTLTGTNELFKVVSQTATVTVGNVNPTYQSMTYEVDINLTAMNLQLSVQRKAGAGPLSIVRIVLVGECEEVIS
jgi:hypothetical protein